MIRTTGVLARPGSYNVYNNINNIIIRAKSSKSSTLWLDRQKNDHYTKMAKKQYYRSRAAFKLKEIDDKFRLFNKNSKNIVDLGFAPGAWTQVAIERMNRVGIKSKILGVDLINCAPPSGSHFIQGDIYSRKTHNDIREFFVPKDEDNGDEEIDMPVDLIISDMMSNTSGIGHIDHLASMDLCDATMILSLGLLKTRGCMVMKYYRGLEGQLITERLHTIFERVYDFKPDSSRDQSKESYLIGLRKRRNLSVDDVFK
ncbi:mitochondrial rRNA methyltransferase [Scheffersomyces amazonensis]|uniref:mitochondrial rRNA methyltransferase n=1 Tax=Scheffersomyces amazonensis TaxID=1078765 RepID=UPI00315CF15A